MLSDAGCSVQQAVVLTMDEITLDRAILLLSSEKLKERTDALADLKHILQKNKRSSKLTTLNDRACHKIFESLFRFIYVERSAFNRASKTTPSKTPSASRLSACASVLRTAVDIFLRNLRTKSVRAIVDHITETLSDPGEGLWELLCVDYMKCLAALLHYPPHVEHLGVVEWERLMGFCLRSIDSHKNRDSQLTLRNNHRSSPDAVNVSDVRSTPSQVTPILATRERHIGSGDVEEVVTCIQLLTRSPTAPIQAMAGKILHGLAKYAKSSISGSARQLAFSSINTVATRVLFDQSELVRTLMLELIPVVRRLWTTKFSGLKDELLVTIMLCMIILTDTVRTKPSESLSHLIDGLQDTLYSEYVKRSDKEILQLDDLSFPPSAPVSMESSIFGPRLGNTRSEHNWTLVWAIATLIKLSEELAARLSEPEGLDEISRKKQRFTSKVEDVLRDSFSSSGTKRVCSLQLIPFLINGLKDIEAKTSLLERLIPNILDDNDTMSSWSMVAISSFICDSAVKQPFLREHWKRVWDLTSRVSTSQHTSRAACYLMDTILRFNLLEYSIVAETTRSMLLSVNINGPSSMSDSSLALWATVIRISTQMNPGTALNASKQVCGWLRELWTVGTTTDKLQVAQVAAFARPLDLLNLLLACTNRTFELSTAQFTGPASSIAKTWYFHQKNRRLLEYLFHLSDLFDCPNPWDTWKTFSLEPFTRQDPNDILVLDLLRIKSEIFLQAWQSLFRDKSHHVTVDIVQILGSFCIVVALYAGCLPRQLGSRLQDLRRSSQHLWNGICSFLAVREIDFTYACLELLYKVVPPSILFSSDLHPLYSTCLNDIVRPFVEVLEQHRRTEKECVSSDTGELMDLDDPLLSPDELSACQQSIITLNREALPLLPNLATLQRSMTIELSVFSILTDASTSQQLSHTSLIEYLTELDYADILSSQSFFPYVCRACSTMGRDCLLQILENLAEKCLQSYELERCESSLCLCIRMMSSFIDSWSNGESDDLSDAASDIYTWFIDVLLEKKKATSGVYIALAEFLECVLMSNASSSGNNPNLSPRTSLFTIVQDGDIPVKFSAASLIPRIFGHFLLKDHDAVFDDFLGSLPRDPDWGEGIALRLFALSQLASQWHTLLRRSIYHMFETPAQVPSSVQYAEKCLRTVAESLGLVDAKELFRLFSSQILYTWTESHSINEIPFSVFGYTSLRGLLLDVQDEAVGQIMMRSRDSESIQLENCMNAPFNELLTTSFYKAAAYGIARDISIPPEQGSHRKSVESRLRKLLGADQFMVRIEEHFPLIIATLFRSLDQYEQIERAFSKRANFRYALAIMEWITGKSASKTALPANQQPSFRARYLIDELEFLCKRTGYELETIWTPTLASFVCRALFESIHPALGSLHACSVIRKIRILVCVAGPVMLRDYPFEMILHALRPFLTDLHCSEDALGIFWYLLEAGAPYLRENPRFMAGIAVSTFVSLKKFFASSPEKTTQQAQFKVALENALEFHRWFGEYLENYKPQVVNLLHPGNREGIDESFRRLVQLSRKVSAAGNATKGTNESGLLLEILRDRDSEHGLLSRPISDLVLSLLCADFKRPSDYHKDVIQEDKDAIDNSVAVWETLQNLNVGTEYRLWAARVIGRAFAATGKINNALLREQDPSAFEVQNYKLIPGIVYRSKAHILQVLCDMLQNNSPLDVGLVERTLQLVVNNFEGSQDIEDYPRIIPETVMKALIWNPYPCPAVSLSDSETRRGMETADWSPKLPFADWARNIALLLCKAAASNPVVGPLSKILNVVHGLAVRLLPYILHDVLLAEFEEGGDIRHKISHIFKKVLREIDEQTIPHARLVISCILYLRTQPRPEESTIAERDEWLELDYEEASFAANKCCMNKTCLLFLEIHASRMSPGSRRSSLAKYNPPSDFLHDVFKKIDDPDFFYGIQERPSLASVMERLDYESEGIKNLLFHSAQYDSEMQMSGNPNPYGVLKALNSTNLQGIASAMFSVPSDAKDGPASLDSMLQAATSLQQWDISVSPVNQSPPAIVFKVFQNLNTLGTMTEVLGSMDEYLLATLDLLANASRSANSVRAVMRALGTMTEIGDVLSSTSTEQIEEEWQKIMTRGVLMRTESFSDAGKALNAREALFSSIKCRKHLRSAINLSDRDAQLLEIKAIRQSLEVARDHEVSQASLKSAICLSNLTKPCASLGINIDAAAMFDLANVLWDQGEMAASIRMLQQLKGQNDLSKQAIPISRAELLVTLGHHVAEARLEKPEAIIQEYLSPAVKELKGRSEGEDASRVFHGFAMFCDQQLQNQDGLEDFRRVEQLRNRKEQELLALEEMLRTAEGKEMDSLRLYRAKAKQWFDLDDREYQRLRRSREAFLEQCLENYLLSLKASDNYNSDALRFCALWLDNSSSPTANTAVSKYLNQVPSRKFAPLMNQLSSRLLDVKDAFQSLLFPLLFRICVDHPFHGMYQMFASSKSKGGKDDSALSRFRAAVKLTERLKNDKRQGETWVAVHNANISYVRFAIDRPGERLKSGAKVLLRDLPTGLRMEQDASVRKIPPPTMKIELRDDCDYSNVPRLSRFRSEFRIASGVSAPKIVTAIGTDGVQYKQLFKGGNDDLRQDAIMEQVFEQVSSLLKDHRATRQRNLGIRTYKVLPLTSNAGIIEFVPNTIPLHDYLLPAHQRYYPKDMKPSTCRKHIGDVQTRSLEQRIKTFRQVTEHFHPVMRYFFMEKFSSPDDWFNKRLAYTRSTAAISILGHVLGLGDRHGHNILLDERTGEVVHIDLGVAFEQGRVLPVPEVVPFRLTRDLVDGMGITKTEGVFRRCCEFTLEALRQESYSIMTILDVLRYDPLYSWTLSPLRMKKMQDNQTADGEPPLLPGADNKKGSADEPSETDRALTVVAKKLSKTLSVTATVNELIQQATDERNLAVLYCGWAAYA